MSLATKLHPNRFSAMSGKMAAIVAYILAESWTEPEIAALSGGRLTKQLLYR